MTEKKSAVDQLLALAGKLSTEEKAALIESGFVVPGVVSKNTKRTLGYRCAKCNQVPIEFVGSSFVSPDGEDMDGYPIGLRPQDVPWIQPEGDPSLVDRRKPVCCYCLTNLWLPGGRFTGKMFVGITEFKASRDAAYSKIKKRRRNRVTSLASLPANTDGTGINLREEPTVPRDIVDPAERESFSQLADETGMGKAVMGS